MSIAHKQALRWVLSSPNLLAQSQTPFPLVELPTPAEVERICALPDNLLNEHLAQRSSHFLGPYFEALWQFYLMHSERYALLEHSVQFHEHGRTLGEMDFIVFDHLKKQHVHQELAVKFYLQTPMYSQTGDSQTPQLWVGPNANDRLDLKLSHLEHKQLKLSSLDTVRRRLEAKGIENIHCEALIKGQLFYPCPYTENLSSQPIERGLNPGHLKGRWMKKPDFYDLLSRYDNHQKWIVFKKLDWIRDPVLHQEGVTYLDTPSLKDYLQHPEQARRAQLISPITENQKLFGSTDQRIMLVPSDWPRDAHTTPPLQTTSMNK